MRPELFPIKVEVFGEGKDPFGSTVAMQAFAADAFPLQLAVWVAGQSTDEPPAWSADITGGGVVTIPPELISGYAARLVDAHGKELWWRA